MEQDRQGHAPNPHDHAHLDYGRAFAIGIALNLLYVAGEAVAGILSGSLALLADAGHNLSDVLSLSLSWGAAVLSRRRPSGRFTYGLRSSSILAALANAVILLLATAGSALDAVAEGVDAAAVRAHLLGTPGVTGLHDLHIWGMSTTETALTCHLVMPDGHPGDAMLNGIAQQLHHRFGIHHATIQIELADTDEACVLTPEHVV